MDKKNLLYLNQVIKTIGNVYLPFGRLVPDRRRRRIRMAMIEAIMELPWTRYENLVPHGKWNVVTTYDDGTYILECGYCKARLESGFKYKWCPECGAKMDLPSEDEE